jgi:hypothetical protein
MLRRPSSSTNLSTYLHWLIHIFTPIYPRLLIYRGAQPALTMRADRFEHSAAHPSVSGRRAAGLRKPPGLTHDRCDSRKVSPNLAALPEGRLFCWDCRNIAVTMWSGNYPAVALSSIACAHGWSGRRFDQHHPPAGCAHSARRPSRRVLLQRYASRALPALLAPKP